MREETREKREGLTTHVQIEKDGEEEGGEGKMRLERARQREEVASKKVGARQK